VSELRRFLAELVPDYMVPAAFVCLDALPLTPNGKVDRRALPEPGTGRQALDTPFVAPTTAVEQTLAGIWAEVLDLDRVGIHDRFLDLGGDSLLASRVLARIPAAFGVEPPMRELLAASTVAEMAMVLLTHAAAKVDPETLGRIVAEAKTLSDGEARRLRPDDPEIGRR
jgi:acyl carrier protein